MKTNLITIDELMQLPGLQELFDFNHGAAYGSFRSTLCKIPGWKDNTSRATTSRCILINRSYAELVIPAYYQNNPSILSVHRRETLRIEAATAQRARVVATLTREEYNAVKARFEAADNAGAAAELLKKTALNRNEMHTVFSGFNSKCSVKGFLTTARFRYGFNTGQQSTFPTEMVKEYMGTIR